MKHLLILLFIVVFISACNINKGPVSDEYSRKKNIEEINKDTIIYNDDNFRLINGLNLLQSVQSDSFNSYQLQDIENRIFYRINVLNLENSLNELGLNKFERSFRKTYFASTIKGLKKEKINYQIIQYLDHEAITYELITKSEVMNNKESLFKTRFLEVLNINKVYTFSVIASSEDIDSSFNRLKENFSFIYDEKSNRYNSIKYNYEVYYPDEYSHKKANYSNIDFKVVKKDGTNILINVSPRRSEEYGLSGFDYTQEIIEQAFSSTPSIEIVKSEKRKINNIEMFLLYTLNTKDNRKTIDVFFFNGDYGYDMSFYTGIDDFEENKDDFLKTIESFKFINN